eukprot:12938928-Prorocentrum_lima.AAC.1
MAGKVVAPPHHAKGTSIIDGALINTSMVETLAPNHCSRDTANANTETLHNDTSTEATRTTQCTPHENTEQP